MESSFLIMQEAQFKLRGKWIRAIGVTVVYFLACFAILFFLSFLVDLCKTSRYEYDVSRYGYDRYSNFGVAYYVVLSVVSILYSIVYLALSYYIINYFLTVVRGKTQNKADFPRFLTVASLCYLYRTLWSLLCLLPLFILMIVGEGSREVVYLCVIIGIITFTIVSTVKGYAYALSGYIARDNLQLSGDGCIDLSQEMMKGYKTKLFKLDLRFLPWFLLCVLSLGIGFLCLYPYWVSTRAIFYEQVKTEWENKQVENIEMT